MLLDYASSPFKSVVRVYASVDSCSEKKAVLTRSNREDYPEALVKKREKPAVPFPFSDNEESSNADNRKYVRH